MEQLLTALRRADLICKQANTHFDRAAKIEQQLNALATEQKKSKTKWIIIGFAIWFAAGMVGAILQGIPAVGMVLSALVSLAGLTAAVYLGMNGFRREQAALAAKISAVQRKAQEERNLGQQVFADHYEALAFLPDDYWYPMATSYLVKAVNSRRVTNLGEALDRFDAQRHRWQVEEANAHLVAQQQAQTAHLRSISTSSKVSAVANVTNTLFNIASRL